MTALGKFIWCPACGCDVRDLLSTTMRKQAERNRASLRQSKADLRQVQIAIGHLRRLVKAMEAHAQEKADVMQSVPDIYRLWSDEILGEVAKRFPSPPTETP